MHPPRTATPTALRLEPIEAHSFAPFGTLVQRGPGVGVSVNLGAATRHALDAALEHHPDARHTLAIYHLHAVAEPVVLRVLERHPQSAQLFVPMGAARYLVCVCPADAAGEPDLAGLRAFVAEAGQGILYRRGVWHHPLLSLGEACDLLMAMGATGTAADCETRDLEPPIPIAT